MKLDLRIMILASLILISSVLGATGQTLDLKYLQTFEGKDYHIHLYLWSDKTFGDFVEVDKIEMPSRFMPHRSHYSIRKRDAAWLLEATKEAQKKIATASDELHFPCPHQTPGDSVYVKVSPAGNWLEWRLSGIYGRSDLILPFRESQVDELIRLLETVVPEMMESHST